MLLWNRAVRSGACRSYAHVGPLQQALFPQNTTEIVTDVIRVLFILYYSVHAIILWAALGDQIGNTDCSSLFGASTDLDNFLVLWKVTAVAAWVLLVVYCVLVVLVATAAPEKRWRAEWTEESANIQWQAQQEGAGEDGTAACSDCAPDKVLSDV